jgi:hypothetical protein
MSDFASPVTPAYGLYALVAELRNCIRTFTGPGGDVTFRAADAIEKLCAELADHERCGWSEKAWDGLAREADLRAEIDHLRAELATALDDHGHAVRSLAKREAAIARVRRLCNESEQGYDWSCFPADVLRALDGVE